MVAEPSDRDLGLSAGRLQPAWRQVTRSVRSRTAAMATLIVGVTIVVGAVALVISLRLSMSGYLRTAAELRADDVADVLAGSDRPLELAVDDEEDVFVQVVDEAGDVVMSSPNLTGEPAVASLGHGESTEVSGLDFEDDTFLVVGHEVARHDGNLTVLVGRNAEVIGESVGAVIRLLVLGVPVLLVVTAAATWQLAGRALAPVDRVRAEVEGITAADLARRLEVPRSGDELARLTATMNAMLARLEEAQIRQRQFVSDASHELRSPLATVRQHAETALAHPASTDPAELAEVVLAEELRLQRLVEDMLWLARGDETALVTAPRTLDLDDLVLEELTRLRSISSHTVDASGLSGGRVSGDPRGLRHVVRNLTDNADQHAGSTVRLALGQWDDQVVLTVEDDGPGVPEAERVRIFDRFIRLEQARDRSSGGSGLGLAIVRAIVDAHGGTVEVADSPLGGARFEVRLPAVTDG